MKNKYELVDSVANWRHLKAHGRNNAALFVLLRWWFMPVPLLSLSAQKEFFNRLKLQSEKREGICFDIRPKK